MLRRTLHQLLLPLGLFAASACTGKITGSLTPGDDGLPNAGGAPPNGTGGSPTVTTATKDALPARIRRLTRSEYDNSVRALLGTTSFPSIDLTFPPDAKQGPANSPAGAAFTVNDAQRVDPVLANKLDAAAIALVAEARKGGRMEALAPCSDTSAAGGEACAKTFIQSFGSKAFRRPPSAEEADGLLRAYHVGADGYTYADGIDLIARVVLQSPGFLYLTEIGEVGAGSSFVMSPHEIASSLSYLLTAGPPDDALLTALPSLSDPQGRVAEATRLIESPAGRERFVRVVREWLGIDDVAKREKSQQEYPDFARVNHAMEQESHDFIDAVLTGPTGTLAELLTADWTIADASLAPVYGFTPSGKGQQTSLSSVKRRGILNQPAFLSVFATNSGSHPVFRGVAIMRRIACVPVPDPGSQGIVVSFPATDPSKSTRKRFEQHAADASCAGCHKTIDNFGFAFEDFDGIGKARTADNGEVETSVTLATGTDIDGSYANSNELVAALAKSQQVKSCLARQIFRSTAARSDESMRLAEEGFLETWKQLPPEQQGRLKDVLLAFVKSPLFVQRTTP